PTGTRPGRGRAMAADWIGRGAIGPTLRIARRRGRRPGGDHEATPIPAPEGTPIPAHDVAAACRPTDDPTVGRWMPPRQPARTGHAIPAGGPGRLPSNPMQPGPASAVRPTQDSGKAAG